VSSWGRWSVRAEVMTREDIAQRRAAEIGVSEHTEI